MDTKPISRQRLLVRAALVAGILASTLGLVAVWRLKPFSTPGNTRPALARAQVHIRIEDERGRAVPSASVFALRLKGGAPVAERWAPEHGILTVPPGNASTSFLVGAPGRRLERLTGAGESRTVRLRAGLRIRITLRNAPAETVAKHVRFLLRIQPAVRNGAQDDLGLDAISLVDLMDNLGPPGSGLRDHKRGEFGYAVSRVQAHAGILVPTPGRYHVRWGLMNTRADTWYSLGDRCGRVIRVRDDDDLQTFTLDVTEGDLQQTLEGLQSSVKRIGGD